MRTLKKLRRVAEKTVLFFSPRLRKIAKELVPYTTANAKMRLGRNCDGGYVVCDDILRNAEVMMSYGVADDISFEMDVIKKYGMKVYAFDGGVRASDFESHPLLSIHEECVGSDEFLYSSQNSSSRVGSYESHLKMAGALEKKIFLKVDIEGAEYDAFLNVADDLWNNVQALVIELHGLEDRRLYDKILHFTKILNRFFVVSHVSGNNYGGIIRLFPNKRIPKVLEVSYIKKDMAKSVAPCADIYPTSLDYPNNLDRAMLRFKYW